MHLAVCRKISGTWQSAERFSMHALGNVPENFWQCAGEFPALTMCRRVWHFQYPGIQDQQNLVKKLQVGMLIAIAAS